MYSILCVALLAVAPYPKDRLNVCEEIARYADTYTNIHPALAISIAYSESRFKVDARSRAGAYGVFQVMPRYAECLKEQRDCDWIAEGLFFLERWVRRCARMKDCDEAKVLALYQDGVRLRPHAWRYARKIQARRARLLRYARRKLGYKD